MKKISRGKRNIAVLLEDFSARLYIDFHVFYDIMLIVPKEILFKVC